jgi:hypothetical protein
MAARDSVLVAGAYGSVRNPAPMPITRARVVARRTTP